ncbi:MAG: zinc-binding alcohol dehydrogenase [Patescibacteria group bacterium]|nr:zinc-binding alcohol dehydrogenase [Patescibacteria group bacterium]
MILSGSLIVLRKPKEIRFQKFAIDTDRLQSSELVAKTLFSAISPGTETAAYTGKSPLKAGKAYPRVLGYCNVATVLKTGKGVASVKPGDLILTNQSHRSIFKIHKNELLAKIPKGADPKQAALAYLYNLGLNAVQATPLKRGMSVAVIGLGVLGLASVEMAKNLKLKTSAFSNSAPKLRLAKKLGARSAFLKTRGMRMEKLADLVVVTSDAWDDWQLALRLVKKHGTISALGFPGRGVGSPRFNPLDPQYFYAKQITIVPAGIPREAKTDTGIARGVKKNIQYILRLLERGKLKSKRLISGTFDFRNIRKAYAGLLAHDQKTVTYILQWQD